MILIPIEWLFHWKNTLFSDKPICVFHSERSSTMSHRPWGKKASANLVRTALDLCSIHWVLNQLPSPNLCGLCRRHKISQTFKSYMGRCTVLRAGLLSTPRIQVNCVYKRVKNDPFPSISPLVNIIYHKLEHPC